MGSKMGSKNRAGAIAHNDLTTVDKESTLAVIEALTCANALRARCLQRLGSARVTSF